MNKLFRNSVFAILMTAVALSGCDKAEDTIDNNNPTNTPSTTTATPDLKDGYGVLAAVRSVSYTTVAGITVPLDINTATAGFFTAPGAGNMVDAGTVTLNSKTLTKSSNNAYVYQNLTDPLSFSSVTWNVTGSSNVPAINYTEDRNMPDYSGFNSLPSTITKANGLTVNLAGTITNADSVYVIIAGGDKYILKRVAGNASQAAFSAADLSVIANTTMGQIQVAPWNYKKEDYNSKPYYFVLETCYTKQGITIN